MRTRLGEVHLAGKWLQTSLRDLPGIHEDGEAVALERRVREDVREHIAKCPHARSILGASEPQTTDEWRRVLTGQVRSLFLRLMGTKLPR